MADLSITPASVVPGSHAKLVPGTSGGTLTAGAAAYYDTTTSTWKLADSDSSTATAGSAGIGIAMNGASAGQPVVINLEDDDLTVGATVSMSAPVYILSDTAGGIAPIADIDTGDYPVVLMVAKSTTKAILKPIVGSAVTTV